MNRYMLDSSAWIEYFIGSDLGVKIRDIVEKETTVTCMLSIAEISDKFSKDNEKFDKFLAFIRNTSSIVNLTVDSCSESGKLKNHKRQTKNKFSLADAVIYISAKENSCTLITTDGDFEGMENVRLIK